VPSIRGTLQKLGLLFAGLHANIENVASAKDNVAVVCGRRVTSVFCGSLKDYVHVTVRINHAATVFDIILEANTDLTIHLLH